MEILFVILLIGMLGLYMSNSTLKTRMDRLEAMLDEHRGGRAAVEPAAGAPPVAAAEPRAFEMEPEPALAPVPEPEPATAAFDWQPDGVLEQEAAQSETLGGLFERLVAGRLLIWLGGVALVLAAVFLIRYSIEVGLLTPLHRMIAAAIFGIALIGAGEYARAGRFADDPRIAQALVGAGIAVLYATTYGSHALYGLLDTKMTSGAMVTVTALALLLSLRHGAPTAVMGLVGGFLTPLLVGDANSGAVPLLAYLMVLDLALFALAWRRGWTWLAAAATVLSFVWTGWLLGRPPDDALAAGVFVILLSLAASLVRVGQSGMLSKLQPITIGLVQVFVLVARTDIGLQAWILFAVLAAAAMALAALRPVFRFAPPLALGLALVLLASKAMNGQDVLVPWAAEGITFLFAGGGLGLALWRRGLIWTAIACVGAAGPLLIVRLFRPELLVRPGWGVLALALAMVPALLVWARRDRAGDETPPDGGLLIAGGAAAVLLGAAVWDLIPPNWVAAGWLVVALGAALAARKLRDLALSMVAAVAIAAGLLRCLYMLPDPTDAIVGGVIGQPVLAWSLPGAMNALTALAVPAILLMVIHFALPPVRARRFLLSLASALALFALYSWYKQAWGLEGGEEWARYGLLERTLLTQALFLGGWLLGAGIVRLPRIDAQAARRAGVVLTAVAAARLVWFDIVTLNPAFTGQWVGEIPVFNLLLPAFLPSAVWLYAARRRAEAATRSGLWLAGFLAALVAGVALLVRQGFQGAYLDGYDLPIAEFYGYSLAGLIVAIGLIVAGVRLKDKALRLAGLLLLTATISKVFLVDASELEGILRILSFLGLGVALIGIGRLYGPVLRAEAGGT